MSDFEQVYSEEFPIERIVEKRIQKGRVYYKLKWTGYEEEDNSWEPEENLMNAKKLIIKYNSSLNQIHKRLSKKQNNQHKKTKIDNNGSRLNSINKTLSNSNSSRQNRSKRSRQREAPTRAIESQEKTFSRIQTIQSEIVDSDKQIDKQVTMILKIKKNGNTWTCDTKQVINR